MRDPVITPSGITYDRKDIEEHLHVCTCTYRREKSDLVFLMKIIRCSQFTQPGMRWILMTVVRWPEKSVLEITFTLVVWSKREQLWLNGHRTWLSYGESWVRLPGNSMVRRASNRNLLQIVPDYQEEKFVKSFLCAGNNSVEFKPKKIYDQTMNWMKELSIQRIFDFCVVLQTLCSCTSSADCSPTARTIAYSIALSIP